MIRETAYHFADYVAIIQKRLGDRVKFWVTLNEPWCAAFLGHRVGVHAPGITDEQSALIAVHHQLLAHGLAARTLRSDGQQANLGPALNLVSEIPAGENPADIAAARLFLDPLFHGEYPKDVIERYQSMRDRFL
jgi:beta-glucosidase